MRAFDRDLIRGGHYGQRPVCRANRPNTWLHRPACKREENPCQLGAVHTWHIASIRGVPVQGASAHARFFDHAGPFGPCEVRMSENVIAKNGLEPLKRAIAA